MANRLHAFADELQKKLRKPISFLSRVGIAFVLLPIYLYLAFYGAICLLFFPTHKSFTYFNSLNPQKGYTGSYVRHAKRKRKLRFGLVSLTAILIVQTVLFGLFTPPQLARAATCNIGVDTTVDQAYIDGGACQDIHITGNATITFTGSINLSDAGTFM